MSWQQQAQQLPPQAYGYANVNVGGNSSGVVGTALAASGVSSTADQLSASPSSSAESLPASVASLPFESQLPLLLSFPPTLPFGQLSALISTLFLHPKISGDDALHRYRLHSFLHLLASKHTLGQKNFLLPLQQLLSQSVQYGAVSFIANMLALINVTAKKMSELLQRMAGHVDIRLMHTMHMLTDIDRRSLTTATDADIANIRMLAANNLQVWAPYMQEVPPVNQMPNTQTQQQPQQFYGAAMQMPVGMNAMPQMAFQPSAAATPAAGGMMPVNMSMPMQMPFQMQAAAVPTMGGLGMTQNFVPMMPNVAGGVLSNSGGSGPVPSGGSASASYRRSRSRSPGRRDRSRSRSHSPGRSARDRSNRELRTYDEYEYEASRRPRRFGIPICIHHMQNKCQQLSSCILDHPPRYPATRAMTTSICAHTTRHLRMQRPSNERLSEITGACMKKDCHFDHVLLFANEPGMIVEVRPARSLIVMPGLTAATGVSTTPSSGGGGGYGGGYSNHGSDGGRYGGH